jgi:phosphoserine phosphatase
LNLILQGLALTRRDIDPIVQLTAAQRVEIPESNVFKLFDAQPHSDLAAICSQKKIDFGFVPETLKLANFKLVAMDMDSTLINIESLDEVAAYAGLKQEIAAITEQSMNGAVDFGESLRNRVALLKGLDASALTRVYDELVELNPGAEKMISALKVHGIKSMLVSGGFSFFTERLKQRLGLDFAFANELEIIAGKLTGKMLGPILGPAEKAEKIRTVSAQMGVEHAEQIIAIGDGANDRVMFDAVGVSIGYRPKNILRRHARYCLDYVGLDGVVHLFS